MQVFRLDRSLGPREPFMRWLASHIQVLVRRNKDDGDAPVELLHLPEAQTTIVSQEEIDHHYANNKRAPDAGVILATFIPRSPFANACRIRFVDKDGDRPSLALLVELRSYPRSKSETVARSTVVLFVVRAADPTYLDQIADGLAFESDPLTEPPPLAGFPR